MKINKLFNRPTRTFIKNSQKKMNSLKKKLLALKQEEKKLEKKEDKLMKKIEKPIQEIRVTFSIESVVKATIAILMVFGLIYLLGTLKSIIIIFFAALFLSAAFNPAVDKLQGYKIPRAIGIIIMYVLVLGTFVVMLTSLVPIIAEQISSLAISVRHMIYDLINNTNSDSWFMSKLQPYINQIWENVDQAQIITSLSETLKEIGSGLTDFAGNAIGAVFAIFNGIFNMLVVLIITFFMVVKSKSTASFFQSLFPSKYSGYISVKSKEVSIRIGEWVRGQILLAITMGIITFIIFTIMGLDYALTLSFVSALAEFVPYLGPLITFAAAALITLNQDPILLFWLIPIYMVLQFLEGNILVPLIVGRSVGLNPIVVLFALLSGATIGVKLGGGWALGLVGMIIAVPMANIISIFVEEYTNKNK